MIDVVSQDVAPALAQALGQIELAQRRLTALVKDLPQEALDYRGTGGDQNSTATLIRHVAYTTLAYLSAIKGEPLSSELEAAYGPYEDEQGRLPAVTGRTAAEMLEEYGRVVEMVRSYLRDKPDAEATRSVTIPWWPQPASVRYVLWHMASHDMMHQGQIAQLQAAYKRK